MVELLRQGGVSASYQVGTITLNGAQFYNWSGFTDAKSACQFLADGAIPATVNGASSCGSLTGNVTSVVMGYSYATSLQSWISSYNANNQTNLQVEDIVGGGVIDTTAAFNIWSGSASPPGYSTPTAQYTWTGDIPDQFRTQLTVQFANISQAFFADESAGKRLRLWGYVGHTDKLNIESALSANSKTSIAADRQAMFNASGGYGRNHSYQLTGLNVSDSFYLPSPTASASTGSPNALNQYSAVGGQSATYDGNGNLLTWYSALPSAGMHTYTYDSENRLSTAAVNGSTTATISYDYDGLGRRVSKTVAGVATTYLLDGDEEIAEYSGATVLRRYITGPGVDDRIAHAEGFSISSPTKTFYHTDHEGSVVDVTDAAGNATQRISYDEYGNLSAGSTATGEPFRYTGRRYDPETGLYYYRARYYSPQLGRFLQPDPIGYQDDLNLYAYAGNDPLDKTDPSGRIAGVDGAAEVGVVLVGAAALYVAAETCTPGSACERAASAGLG